MVEDKFLQSLVKRRPNQPHYMNRSSRAVYRLMSRWNLLVPEEILKRMWEQVR